MTKDAFSFPVIAGLGLALTILMPPSAVADADDPPERVARLAYVEGAVSFQPAGTDDWVAPPVNRPMGTSDSLWSDRDGRVELQMDGSLLRLSSNTAVSFVNLGDHLTQIQLSAGSLLVRVSRLDDDETYEIDTPNLAFSVLRPGLYRLTVDQSGTTTAIDVRRGQGEVTGGGTAYAVSPNEYDVFYGTDELSENTPGYRPAPDAFDAWSLDRDRRRAGSISARYVSADVVGYQDLDNQGTWTSTPDYGYVWFPRGVEPGWAPYQDGHWAYIAPWGYTWVDNSSWGFAPFHYGRWISAGGAWGWVPAPPASDGAIYIRPVYAPALVAWVGVGAGVAWFALGPREVYAPSYPVSRDYVNRINVSNTTVNTTVVNNVYNTTIVNRNVNVTDIHYVNRTVPGAVVATTSQAFTSAQPIARNKVAVDQREMASTQVRAFAPAALPTKQAVLGSGRISDKRPSQAVQTRVVVARTAPPAPPPSFEKRQEAIKNNSGIPLSGAQVRQIQTATPPRAAAVRVAPPAKTLAAPAGRPASLPAPQPVPQPAPQPVPQPAPQPVPQPAPHPAPQPAPQPAPHPAPQPAARPAAVPQALPARTPALPPPEINRPAPAVIHPNEIPAPARPPSPGTANSVLERHHLQEQQQLQAQQEAERLKTAQQQEQEHQQFAKQQVDEARRQQQAQQLELQHQQQTQALMQKHAQEQQQLQEKQQAQKQQQQVRPLPSPSLPPKVNKPGQPSDASHPQDSKP